MRYMIAGILGLLAVPASGAVDVGLWLRHELSFTQTCPGNKDEVEFDAVFTHGASGTSITMPGYYSGSGDVYKISFMPTRTGTWTWQTRSTDCGALDGLASPASGPAINGVPSFLPDGSPHPGMLEQDPANAQKWRFSDSGVYVIPMGFRAEIFFEREASDAEFVAAADFLADIGGTFFDTRLMDEEGFYDAAGAVGAGSGRDRHDYIFCCGEEPRDNDARSLDWKNHDFDEFYWDRLQERLDVLAARGLGIQVMLFADDSGSPGWCGPSGDVSPSRDCDTSESPLGRTEDLVMRHAVARLAAYPVVVFNYIIDQNENRAAQDVNHFVDTIRQLDPYEHPVSNRHDKGGSVPAANQSYASRDDNHIETDIFRSHFRNHSVPVLMDDSWNERLLTQCTGSCPDDCFNPSKQNRPEQIRRAWWKLVVAGGLGGQVRGEGRGGPTGTSCGDGGATDGGYFWLGESSQSGVSHFERDLDSEQWSRLVNPFVRDHLGADFGRMLPDAISGRPNISPGVNEYALLDPDNPVTILYYSVGTGEDSGNGSCCSGSGCVSQVDDDDCRSGGGGSLQVDLRDGIFSGRSYSALWFDPRTGNETAAGLVTGGSQHTLSPPNSTNDDWVLLLRTSSGDPGSNPPQVENLRRVDEKGSSS